MSSRNTGCRHPPASFHATRVPGATLRARKEGGGITRSSLFGRCILGKKGDGLKAKGRPQKGVSVGRARAVRGAGRESYGEWSPLRPRGAEGEAPVSPLHMGAGALALGESIVER